MRKTLVAATANGATQVAAKADSAELDYGALYQIGKLAAVAGQNLDHGLVALRRCLELTPAQGQPTLAAAHWHTGNIFEKKNDSTADDADSADKGRNT